MSFCPSNMRDNMRDNMQNLIETTAPTDTSKRILELIKRVAKHTKAYFWESAESRWALFLLACLLLGTIASVAVVSLFFTWAASLVWTAFELKSMALFIYSIKMILIASISYGALEGINEYFRYALQADWRRWLTKNYLEKLDILKLQRLGFSDVTQRIQVDIKDLVDNTVGLSMSLLSSILTFSVAIGSLWIVGGAITLVILGASLTIPGYMVWAAIGFTVLCSLSIHLIGNALSALSNKQESIEAKFRANGDSLNTNADEIALENKQTSSKEPLIKKSDDIYKNSYDILKLNAKITALKTILMQISFVFADVMAAPKYFAGKIGLGQMNKIGFAFTQVQMSLNWYFLYYETIAIFKTKVDRMDELEKAMQDNRLDQLEQIKSKENDDVNDKRIYVNNLNIKQYPSKERPVPDDILRGLNLTFEPGKHVLIQGSSGLGKSTLKKVLAGTYKAGEGVISRPKGHHIQCLSQEPLILFDTTLREFLTDGKCNYSDEEYVRVFNDAKLAKKDFNKNTLDKTIDSLHPSRGLKQKLAFAKILLNPKKPDWLILDEATASIDKKEHGEDHMYGLLKQDTFKNTTIITIAHGDTLKKFHDVVIALDLCLDKDGNEDRKQNVTMDEKPVTSTEKCSPRAVSHSDITANNPNRLFSGRSSVAEHDVKLRSYKLS